MGIYLITHKARLFLQEIRNTFYYTTTVGEPSDSEFQDMADEIRVDWVAGMDQHITPNYAFYGMDHRRVDTAGLLSFSKNFTAGEALGISGNDSVATQVACLVSNKGSTTKPNRARTYLAGLTEAGMTDSLWIGSVKTAVEVFIDLQSDLNAGGTNPIQRVSAQWNTSHTQVIVTNDLSGAASVMSAVPATQRRRRIGVGI